MGITYPKDKGVLAEFGTDPGYTSPFDIRQLKKSATAVKKAKNSLKKRKAERFNKQLQASGQ